MTRKRALPINRMRQLQQIQRHSPLLFQEIDTSLAKWPALADSIIANGIKRLRDTLRVSRPAPPPSPVLFDLVVAVKKYGYGATCNPSDPVKWLKYAGQPMEKPRRVKLIDLDLTGYDLVETEVKQDEVVYRYICNK